MALPSVWRSEFAGKPTGSFFGFHRIDKLDHALVDVITSGTFECSNVKAGGARGNAGQHGSCLARRAKGAQMIMMLRLGSGGSATLSVTGRCRDGTVIEQACRNALLIDEQYCSFTKISRN
jgi:hypothetical protein